MTILPLTTDRPPGLRSLGYDDRVAAAMAGHLPAGSRPGRVVRVDVDSCVVAVDGEEVRAVAEVLPAVGDWVALDASSPRVEAIVPRWSELAREDERRRQVLAANVDVVLLAVPLDAAEPLADLERSLAAAYASGAASAVVLTKADVATSERLDDVTAAIARRTPDVPVVVTSVTSGRGLEEVRALLQPDRTAVLFGPSGAGKSSLANVLLGAERLATAEVGAGGAGRHTTTARRLLPVSTGGVLIDIPGLRSIGLGGAGRGIARLYADLEDRAERCRFNDCSHGPEPGCAITAAVESGEVDRDRVERWRQFAQEAETRARRRRPRRRRPR